MGTNQYLIAAFEEGADRFDLAAICSGGIAQVPFGSHLPVGPETKVAQWLIAKTRADGFLWHDDNGLFDALIVQLVQRDEHQRPALSRRGRRFDQQILLTPFIICALLHLAHAHLVGLGRCTVLRIGNGNGGYRFYTSHGWHRDLKCFSKARTLPYVSATRV